MANFRSQCGTPVAGGSDDEERWETCHISLKVVRKRPIGGSDYQFHVRGIGPEGKELVAVSEKWTGSASQRDRNADAIHWRLVKDLTEVGWDLVPGLETDWYALHFRRRI